MKTASLPQLKKELELCTHKRLIDLTLRIAKHKIENKELLSYLLFESNDDDYIKEIKDEICSHFDQMNIRNVYLAKKTLRKTIRTITKYSKYMASKEAECQLLLFFCEKLTKSGLPIDSHKSLLSIFTRQKDKINKLIPSLEEDLQYDYSALLTELE